MFSVDAMRVAILILALAAASCAEATQKPAHPVRPFTRVLASEAPSATLRPAPQVDRDFVRRLALTKNFQLGAPVEAIPTPDGTSVLFLRSLPRDKKQSLYELALSTAVEREILNPDMITKGPETLTAEERARRERMRITSSGFPSFEVSKDGARVLVTLSGRIFVLTRATGQVTELPTGEGGAIDPHFSPDGTRIAYVRGADVYAVATEGERETPVTRGGTTARSHGLAEFIAQEELDRYRGFWWSPDGNNIVYEEADTSNVDKLTISDPAHPEREADRVPYPRPGRANADVRLGIVSRKGGATTWISWDRTRFPYVATVTWEKNGPLAIYVLDRLQENGELLAVDSATGRTRTLVAEHDDAWLNVDPSVPRFLPDGRFLWSTERDGASALEIRSAQGALLARLVPSGYRELLHVSASSKTATFLGSDEPTSSRVMNVPIEGGMPKPVVEVPDGVVAARFGEADDVYVARASSRTALPRHYAGSLDGKINRPIPSVAEDPGLVPAPEIAKIGPDAVRVAIVRPRAFDKTRRYAIIDAAYGGPARATVVSSAFSYLRHQWIADTTDAIVVSIDARGTPHRGRAWERALDGKLGAVPLEGHVTTLESLGRTYPEMDTSKVGIYGWSFGGYLSALAVLLRPDVYKVAVVGAPVADWRDYDTAYTERYLGLPDANKTAYDAASLLSHVAPKAGQPVRPLLLVHGTADDNVYFTNTLKLVDVMERAGRPFELMPLVGVTHLPYDPEMSEALWTRTAEFLRAHLR